MDFDFDTAIALWSREWRTGGRGMTLDRVAYCVLYVADLERMTRFYSETLGLSVGERSARFVALGGAGAPLALEAGGPPAGPPRDKEQNPTLVQFAVSDIDGAVTALAARGVRFEGEVRRCPFGALAFFRDPEGNRLALLQPPAA